MSFSHSGLIRSPKSSFGQITFKNDDISLDSAGKVANSQNILKQPASVFRLQVCYLSEMTNRKREGNNPKRRISALNKATNVKRKELAAKANYVGAAFHKLRPADYGFPPPFGSRPHKSVCDDVRTVTIAEARLMLSKGIKKGMFSDIGDLEFPKYVWFVDQKDNVFEAKTDPSSSGEYHGYRLSGDDSAFREYVRKEWKTR